MNDPLVSLLTGLAALVGVALGWVARETYRNRRRR